MDEETLLGLSAVVVLGVGCQWVARRLQVPAILLLLAAGVLAGPVGGLLDPRALFGDALFPGVSLAVGLLLFEGGLGLDLRRLGEVRGPAVRLVTLGALLTFVLAAAAAWLVLPLPAGELALLVGAVLVVSGPTVVGPLLRIARPRERLERVLEWEGIVIDPVGATLGVITLNLILAGDDPLPGLLGTILVGVTAGLVGAALLVAALRWFLVPDDLEVPAALLLVVAAFTAAEVVRPEAGLFATTTLGVALANQPLASIRRIEAFGRPLGAVILGSLFIVLAATIDLDHLGSVLGAAALLVVLLVVVARPAMVAACTVRSTLGWRERAFLACLAPRGIVAAATSSLFALKLAHAGRHPGPLVPVVFLVIVGTCLVYGLAARPAARLLGVARPARRGVALVGNAPWLVALAVELARQRLPVALVATRAEELRDRPDLGFPVHTGSLTDDAADEVVEGLAEAVVASPDNDHNLLASAHLAEQLGSRAVLLLPADDREGDSRQATHAAAWSRRPFEPGLTQSRIERAFAAGAHFTTIAASDRSPAGVPDGVWLFVRIRADATVDLAPRRRGLDPGERLVVLTPPPDRAAPDADRVGEHAQPGSGT